jgi:hypothetical protein
LAVAVNRLDWMMPFDVAFGDVAQWPIGDEMVASVNRELFDQMWSLPLEVNCAASCC